MEFRKNMLFMGVECKPGFKDPTKLTYRVALADGMDSLKMYIEPGQYEVLKDFPPLSILDVTLDYNPTTTRMNYISAEYVGAITGQLSADKPADKPAEDKPADKPAEDKPADKPADNMNNKKAS